MTTAVGAARPSASCGEKRDPRFFGQHILSVSQFDREDIDTVFGVAHEMYGMVERIGTFDLLKGKVLTNLFYEPSTRTSSSFVGRWYFPPQTGGLSAWPGMVYVSDVCSGRTSISPRRSSGS